MLTITNKLNTNVQLAVDALFKLLLPSLTEIFNDPLVLECIKEIDNAVPELSDSKNTLLFNTPFGCIPPEYFSSGTKSFILIVYRNHHPELNWIPSMESMGNNVKKFVFDHYDTLAFPLYCTACGLDLIDVPCLDMNDKQTTLGALLGG